MILDEGGAEKYDIYEPTGLLFDLAKIAGDPYNRDPRDVAAFVRRYGLLWHGADRLGSGECRESLEDWWSASYNLAITADLYVRLKEAEFSGRAEPLLNGPIDYAAFSDERITGDDDSLKEFSSLLLAELISTKMEGCSLGVSSTMGLDVAHRGPLSFGFAHNPPDLETSAYVQLAMFVVSRTAVQPCEGCGRLFAPESGKQKYHSKSCANTSRWRRWNEKQRDLSPEGRRLS